MHTTYRLTFISLITGFLLSILFQVVLIPKTNNIVILTGLFFSLLCITLLFLFVFLLFLMVSFELSRENPKLEVTRKLTKLAKTLFYLGLFSFNVFLHYLIRLFFYPVDGKIIALIFTIVYSTILILFLFILQIIWRKEKILIEYGIFWIVNNGIFITIPMFF